MDEEREVLRRRLYAPGADGQDVDAYRATRPPEVVVETPRRRRPLHLLLLAAVVVVALVGVVLAVLLRPAPSALPQATVLPLSPADRSELETALQSGGAAGIAATLLTRPVLPRLQGSTTLTTRELHGVGDATRSILPPSAPAGHATVLLVTASTGRASWTALRLATAPGSRVVVLRPLTGRSQDVEPGALTATTFRVVDGASPVRLRVDVDPGVRWGAAVVFSD